MARPDLPRPAPAMREMSASFPLPDCDLAAEMPARTLYQEAATHCHSVRDGRDPFEKPMAARTERASPKS